MLEAGVITPFCDVSPDMLRGVEEFMRQEWARSSTEIVRSPLAAATAKAADSKRWYAIHTRSKHEKRVGAELLEKGIQTFVPIVRETHRWSDRKKVVEIPLFPCYAFVCVTLEADVQSAALRQPGVLRWVGCQGRPTPIPEEEIVAIQTVLRSGAPVGPHTFVKFGERVRIRGGSLDGIEGVLTGTEEDRKLIVSVDIVGRSVAVSIQNYELEPVD